MYICIVRTTVFFLFFVDVWDEVKCVFLHVGRKVRGSTGSIAKTDTREG